MKKICLIFIFIAVFPLFAEDNTDLYGNLSVGGGYDSFVHREKARQRS